jgi:hypothetical protein
VRWRGMLEAAKGETGVTSSFFFEGEHFIAVHGTQAIFINHICQRRSRLRRDTATTLGNIASTRRD